MVTASLLENTSPTKYIEKGTDELADIQLMEKKYSTKYFDKSTDEL